MAAVIESTIKSDPVGRWYIEIVDTNDESKREVCYDIEEYSNKIEEMGKDYGADIEVVWLQDENVTDMQIHEIRVQMMAYEQKLAQESNDITN